MTICLTPNITDQTIAAMEIFDAFRLGEELLESRFPRDAARVLEPTSAWAQTALGLALDRQSRHREGAVHHRIAAAMGASPRDATRVELVDRQNG